MEYRKLGNSALQVSRVGLGCMSLDPSDPASLRIIEEAVEAGINYFDTADLYHAGANEEMLGKALKDVRHQVVIATKVGNQLRADGKGWDWNPRKEYILVSVEKSLARLQTDHIDLYQLHGGTLEDPIGETIEAFEQLKQQGKIRYYGISSIRPNVIREWEQRSAMSSVMMQYSLLDRRPEEESLSLLREKGIGVLARGALAQGLLAGKPAKEQPGRTVAEVQQVLDAFRELVGDEQPEALALQFVLAHPAITSAIVGIRTKEQLQDMLKAYSTGPLEAGVYEKLTAIAAPTRYMQHR